MRLLRQTAILTLSVLATSFACDPGSSFPSSRGGGGTTSYATSPAGGRNPLLDVPDAPVSAVNMTPPVAGELDAFAQNRALGRGMNFGNGLDSPKGNNWGLEIEPYMFPLVKEAGFDSIRLPVRWSVWASAAAPYTIEPGFFADVDKAVIDALAVGLRVVLDIHHFGEDGSTAAGNIYSQPAQNHDLFLALWQQIATHYQNYPKELYFEVLNEPRGALESVWNQYLGEAITVIRQSNPGRTIVVGGVEYNKWYQLKNVTFPVGDNNIIATFHYYNPYCVTLQDGQTWEAACKKPDGTKPKPGEACWPVIYPKTDSNQTQTAATQRAKLDSDLEQAAAWAKQANLPLYMGEFGVNNAAEKQTRIDYTTSLARAAEKYDITWAYWELASGFGIWNQSKLVWDQPLLEALIPPVAVGGAGGGGGAGAGMAGMPMIAGASAGSAGTSSSAPNATGAAGSGGRLGVTDGGSPGAGTAGAF